MFHRVGQPPTQEDIDYFNNDEELSEEAFEALQKLINNHFADKEKENGFMRFASIRRQQHKAQEVSENLQNNNGCGIFRR